MKLILSSYKAANGALSDVKMRQVALLNDSRTFIETGTYLGDTADAMQEIFEQVYSIELSEDLYREAAERFVGNEKVIILLGNSSEKLQEAARLSKDPNAIFWLDAHWSGGNTARGTENTPVINELKTIKAQQMDSSVIMIDDLRYFVDIPKGFDVHEANSGYPLLHELLAHVKKLWPSHATLINGDILFIVPTFAFAKAEVSSVLWATDMMRRGLEDLQDRNKLEIIIGSAQGEERETIMELPETFKHSLGYGIGGEYLYWRALVHEHDGSYDLAKGDFQLARKCGVSIASRSWE